MSDILYQIFPDRWRRAGAGPLPADGAWRWRGHPARFSSDRHRLTTYPTDQHTFFGGDLEGIRQSLDYLQELGVTGLYLTPIFQARSTHRYDAVDFLKIDPLLGERADFETLSRDLRGRGMRLILDGVFNHTSEDHPWHLDRERRRRYYIPRDADRTMTWQDGGTLPKLDTQNPEVAREILDVVAAWPEADGWRLDAAHLLPRDLLRRIRRRAAPRPIVVEDWLFARHYFDRGLADGTTNIPFREMMRLFFREDCSPETLLERLDFLFRAYPARAAALSWNLLENHDTPRFRTVVGRERAMRALVLLFTLPGTPLLYHGGEIGMEGKTEAESRSPMLWDRSRWDHDLHAHVRHLIQLRRSHPALSLGTFRPLAADNRSRTLVFERVHRRSRVLVALNDGYVPFRGRAGGREIELAPGEWRVA